MDNLKIAFGKRLKTLRERAGITQDQLAERLDCDVSTISKMERGIHGPRFPIFESIVCNLGAHPREFFEFPWSVVRPDKRPETGNGARNPVQP